MKKTHLAAALLAVLVAVGCATKSAPTAPDSTPASSAAGQNAYPYSFVDSTGAEITLTAPPQRVAVLFSSFADVWSTAGGAVSITVGESVERGFAPAGVLLVDQGAGKTIDRELLLSYEPDLVVCSSDIPAQLETAKFLSDKKIPAAAFRVENFSDYLLMLKICTDITQNAEAYQTHGVAVEKRIDTMKSDYAAKKTGEPPEILFVRAGSKSSATKAKTARESFVCVMLDELGTRNIADDAPVLLDGLSLEEILLRDPDYIFFSMMGDEQAARAHIESVLADPSWQQLTAVKNHRYDFLPKELFQFKPNARWDEAYRYLIDLLDAKETT